MPPPHLTSPGGIRAPARFQAQLQALEDARANGEMIVLSSYAANGRRVMIIELEDAPDEASRLEIAAAGLQTKATAVRSAVAPVLEVEAPK